MRLTARDELVISVIIDKTDGPAGRSTDSQNSCFVVTSKFVNTPNLVYKVSRTFPDFLKLRDELERILPGNFTNNEYSIPIQATVLEAFLRKAATFVEIKTSIQFASFLSSINLIAFSSSVSSKSLKSISNSYGDNLDISNVKQLSVEEIREYISKQEKCMTAMVSAASTLVKPTSKLAGALSDLKEGFLCLGHLDIDDAKIEESYHSNQYLAVIISTLAKVSKESLSTADMYTIDFIEPLVEYSRMLKSITTAINQWTSKKKHYHKMMAELENKSSGPASQILLLSKQEFDRATNRLVTDFIDFRRRRIVDFKRIMGNFIQLQMAYHGSSNDLWNAALVSCAELEGQASTDAMKRAAIASELVVPTSMKPKAMSSSSDTLSVASSAKNSVNVELQRPHSPNSSSRTTLLAPGTDARADNVERFKNIDASFSKGNRNDLQFQISPTKNSTAITETVAQNSWTEQAMQTEIHQKLPIKEQQQQQHFTSQDVEAERLQVSNKQTAKKDPVYGEGLVQHVSFSSESDSTINSSSSSSNDSGLIKASSSGDSMVSKWDANPLRNNSNNTTKSSIETNKYGGIGSGSSKPVTNVAMRERNLNNDLFKRHETNPLKNKVSRVATGVRTSEFNNSPKTQEQGFGLHIGASYIKHKEKDTEDMDVAKYCEDRGLLKLDGISEGNSASISNSSSYGSTIQNNNLESVFGSVCGEPEVGKSVNKDSQSSDSFSWGTSASMSMSISISESSQGSSYYRSFSGDYSGNTIPDENEVPTTSEDLARKSLYYLRAQKDVLEVSPAVSTYSRSASIDEWASPLSPGSRGVYTYNASVEFINDESPIKRTSLTLDMGIAETPNQYPLQRKQVISLQSQQKSVSESDRQQSQSQPSPRYSIAGTINHPLDVASSSEADSAKPAMESESIDSSSNQGKSNNASIDTGSLQWDSNPFRKMSIKRSASSTVDTRKVVSPPRPPLLPKVAGEGSSARESLDQNAMLSAPASSSLSGAVGKSTPSIQQQQQQQQVFDIQSRQPVVSAAATSNLLEPSTTSEKNMAASEANSPKISDDDLLKWDANPLRNKSSRPSTAGSAVRPENTTPGSNKLLSSIVLGDSGSRQSLLSNKGPSRLKGGFSPAGSPVPSAATPLQQVDSGRTVPVKPVIRTTSPNPLAVEAKPSEIQAAKSPKKPSLAASLFSVIEEPSLSKSSVSPTNINQLTPSENVPSGDRRAYSLPKEANVNLQDAFSASQLAASMSKDLLSELSLEPLTSERPGAVPIPQSSPYRSHRLGTSPVRPTAPRSPPPKPSPLPVPVSFPSSKNPSPTPMARVTRTTEERPVQPVNADSASPSQLPATSTRDVLDSSMQLSNSSSHEVKNINSPLPAAETAKSAPSTSSKSGPPIDDPDLLKWDANPLRNKSKRAAVEESGTPDKAAEKAVIGSNKLLSSMLLYDNAGKDIRANMQNKSMLAARNKGILSPPSTGMRQSPLRTAPANDSPTPSSYPQSDAAAAAVSTPVAQIQQQKFTAPSQPPPVVASIPVVVAGHRPTESEPLTIVTSTTEAKNKLEASETARSPIFSQDARLEQQKSTGTDSFGMLVLPSDAHAPVMARRPSQVRAPAQSPAAPAIGSPGPTATPAAALTSPNGAPTNNNKFLSSIVIGSMEQRNPLSKMKSTSILANRQKGDSNRPIASVPANDGGQPEASSSSLLLRPRKPVEDSSASFGFDDLSSKPSVSSQPTSQLAPTKETVDLTSAEVAAKWDLNPLRSTSKKKTNIVS